MPPLMALGLGLNFANSLFGGFQLLRGLSQAKSNQRPQYNIPQEIGQNLNQAQLYAQQGLPMDVYNRAMGNIDRNTAFGLRGMSDRRGGLVGLAGLNQGANDAYNNLAMQDAQARMNNLAQLYNARSTMAGYRDKAFDINKMQPYMQKAQSAQALQGAGLQNIMSGFQGAGNTASAQAYYNALTSGGMGTGMGNPLEMSMAKMGNPFGGIQGQEAMSMANIPFMQQNGGFNQPFNPYQVLMDKFSNPYSGIGNPNFVLQPQFFNQKY